MEKAKQLVAAQVAVICLVCLAGASAQTNPTCTSFTVVTQDKLKNVKEGLSPDDAKWFREKIEKKYPGACYVDPTAAASTVFYITITPDTYNGTRIVNQTSTQATPVRGTITDQDGNVSYVNGTEQTTSTSSTAVPYSFEYGIFTLVVQSRRSDGTFETVQTFQQKGLYNTLYGIPLGGRGHHPAHAVIEDAAKWVNGGGLTDQRQSSLQPPQPLSSPAADAGTTLQARAEQGDAQAQFDLGLDYNRGQGVPQDNSQSAVWYRKAAEQGLAEAQLMLGVSYINGIGVPQDYAQSAVWLNKSAVQEDAQAQFLLGWLYQVGKGVAQDYTQAVIWYRKAAEQGIAEAQFSLGADYELGLGVPKDYAESYFWLDLAALGNLKSAKQEDVTKERDQAASHLTPADLSQAQARASKWFAEHTISK